MTDIIVINPNLFAERGSQITVDPSLQKKYEDIFQKYSCFTTPASVSSHGKFVVNNNNNDNNSSHYHKGRHYFGRKNHQKDEDRSFITRKPKDKDIAKVLLGIMNVINQSNYNKMLNKIRLLKSDANINIIVVEILKTSTVQNFYMNIYMKLLHDIIEHCSESEKQKTFQTITDFIASFIDAKEWLTTAVPENDDYSAFCDFQKAKNIVIAKNVLILELVKRFSLVVDLHSYVRSLVTDLDTLISENDDDKSTAILHMLVQIAKSDEKLINVKVNDLFVKSSSKKNNFVMEELAELLNQKIEA
jgi:hypothetical protein